MKIISLIQEKGGVGKTSLSVHLAAWLAMKGERVVLVDVDAQANATTALGIAESGGVHDLLVRNASFNDVLRLVSTRNYAIPDQEVTGELYVVPSNIETRGVPEYLTETGMVREKFSDLDGWADTIVFDTPPTPSNMTSEIYTATDFVIYPCVCEPWSIEGLDKSMKRLHKSTRLRVAAGLGDVVTIGIIPAMYRGKTGVHSAYLGQLQEQYGELVKKEIPLRITWSEAAIDHQTVFAYAPDSDAAQDALNFAEGMYEQARSIAK